MEVKEKARCGKMKKLETGRYDYSYKLRNGGSYINNEYGFEGEYYHEKGIVIVFLSQNSRKNYCLMLYLTIGGREYHRNIDLRKKCSKRYASIKAKEFIEEINKIGEK